MNRSWFLARRLLLWRQERRKLNWSAVLSIAGLAVGAAVLVLSISILNGFESSVRESLLLFEKELVILPLSDEANPAEAGAVLAEEGIRSAPYAERKLVIRDEKEYRLVTARIVADLDTLLAELAGVLVQEMPYEPFGPGVVVGSLLADKLALLPGDAVQIMSPLDISLADPRPPQISVAVQAIYEIGVLDFDDAYIFIDRAAAERFMPRLAAITGLAIDGADAGVQKKIEQLLSDQTWEIRTWEAEHTDLLTAMKLEKLGSMAVLFLIILVASFNATSTMVMLVMEKYREIGVLRALGAHQGMIKTLFLRQGLIIGLAGTLIGVGSSALLVIWHTASPFIPSPGGLYTGGYLPMKMQFLDLAIVSVGAILLSLGAAWYPARYATRIEPGQAVNYQK